MVTPVVELCVIASPHRRRRGRHRDARSGQPGERAGDGIGGLRYPCRVAGLDERLPTRRRYGCGAVRNAVEALPVATPIVQVLPPHAVDADEPSGEPGGGFQRPDDRPAGRLALGIRPYRPVGRVGRSCRAEARRSLQWGATVEQHAGRVRHKRDDSPFPKDFSSE